MMRYYGYSLQRVILYSIKASYKALSQLTGAEALLQKVNKVDSDD